MTEEQKREAWARGQNALATIMKYVKVEKIEALAKKVEDKSFRDSVAFKMFINSL